jgi:hypothetical protein
MKTGRHFAPEEWGTDPETGRFDPERPDDFGRNRWTTSAGMAGIRKLCSRPLGAVPLPPTKVVAAHPRGPVPETTPVSDVDRNRAEPTRFGPGRSRARHDKPILIERSLAT